MVETQCRHHQLRSGTTARILYVNGDAKTSERTIDIIREYTSRYGVTYLRAYCHLRAEERTFRVDRILAVLETRGPERAGSPPSRPASTGGAPSFRAAPQTAGPSSRPASIRTSASGHSAPRRHVFGKLLAAAAALVVAFWLWNMGEEPVARYVSPPVPRPSPPAVVARVAPARLIAPTPVPTPTPAPTEDEAWMLEYRGQRIEARRGGRNAAEQTTYTLIVSGRTFDSMHDARVAINTSLLSVRTGISDPRAIDLFVSADQDQDGEVSWGEIQRFQTALDRNYSYQSNTTALRPNEFLAAGGGDCEDWALVTAGMLQFWGIPVFIGSLSSSTGHHAVALVPTASLTTSKPPGATTITIPPGSSLRAGSYVPIDYTSVGSLTNAVAIKFTVERIWVPEEIYGWSI